MKRVARVRQRVVIHESPESHKGMAEFIQSEIIKKQWIYKIISGERENDRVIYQDEAIMMLPDTEAPNEAKVLNWLVIFKDQTLLSMRSLDGRHVKLLKFILMKIKELLPPDMENHMTYFHYPPSVWQLHIHVAAPCDALRTTNSMQKVFFLEDVISNLTIDPYFFQKATITYILPTSHEISDVFATKC